MLIKKTGNYWRLFILFTYFFVIAVVGFSNTFNSDSLISIAQKVSSKNKASLYLEIAYGIRDENINSAEHYSSLGLKYAIENNQNELIVEHYIFLVGINSVAGKYSKVQTMLNKAVTLCEGSNMFDMLVLVKIAESDHFVRVFDYSNAIRVLYEAKGITDKNNLTEHTSLIYSRLAFFFLRINELAKSVRFFKKSIEYSKNDEDRIIFISNLLHIGHIFSMTNNYDSSIYYYKVGLREARRANNKIAVHKVYKQLSDFYVNQNKYDTAFMYIDSSVVLVKELGKNHELAVLITRRAHIYSLLNDFESTLSCNKEALRIREEFGDVSHSCPSYISIGGNYTELGKYDSALYYLNRGVKIAENINRIEFMVYGYSKTVKLYEKKGDYKNALKYLDLASMYSDSILISKTNYKVQFFINQFENESEKSKLELVKIEKRNRIILYLIIIAVVASIVVILLIILNNFLRKSKKEIVKLSKVIKTTNQSVVIADVSGKITYINDALLKMGGYANRNEILGKMLFQFADNDSKLLFRDEIIPTVKSTGQWRGEVSIRKKDGSYIIADNSCLLIDSGHNKTSFFVNFCTDITERKQIERNIHESRESLKLALQTRDRMFSIIAHDLTGPFNSILGFSKLMATEFFEYQTDDHIRFSQLIYESIKNTFDLLTNLLHWSKSQLGRIDIFLEEVILYDIVYENVQLLKVLLMKKELLIQIKIDKDIIVNIDTNTMGVVVRNIVSNAIKFTQRGGTIRIIANKVGNSTSIVFVDNGVGIASEDLQKVFDSQRNMTTLGTEYEKGTGLGLLLCKEFVELNNGTIAVESELGIGSKFSIILPE